MRPPSRAFWAVDRGWLAREVVRYNDPNFDSEPDMDVGISRGFAVGILRRIGPGAALILLVVPATSSCGVATGAVGGGESLIVSSDGGGSSPCDSDSGMATWTDLYNCYFSISPGFGCGTMGCHSSVADEGAVVSAFVCGADSDSCWYGMTHAASGATLGPIVPLGGASDPTTTTLWRAIRKPASVAGVLDDGGPNDNMPFSPVSDVFSQLAIDQIDSWIIAGAQEN